MVPISEALAIALEHHRAGRLPAAEQVYRQILQADPNHADAHYLLGAIAHQTGRAEAAVEYMRQAIRLNGAVPSFHINLAKVYHVLDRVPEAVDCYRRALELKPDLAEAHNNLGVAAKLAGRAEEAKACFHRALECKPGYGEALNNLGNVYREEGKTAEAINCFRRALAVAPSYAEAHNNLGLALQEQGNADEPGACFRRALELKPDYAEAHNNLGLILRRQGKLPEAAAAHHRALALKANLAEAHSNLGNVLMDQGQPKEAAACYRQALKLKPGFAEAHNNLGLALAELNQPEEAAASFRRALALHPDSTDALSNLGNILKVQGLLDEAVACFHRALALNPNLAEAHNNLGLALRAQGKRPEAVASHRRAVHLKPDLAEAHCNLGIAYENLGQREDAIACFRRAVALKPDLVEAHNNLGLAFKEAGMLDDAIASFRQALHQKLNFPGALNNLANAYKDQGRLDEAVGLYRRAVELEPSFAEAHSNLLYTQLFHPGCGAQTLRDELERWERLHAAACRPLLQPHLNERSPDRRLRIGYVSPDFRDHCQAFFTTPLFASHDRETVEIMCYSDVMRSDDVTARLRSHADSWKDISGLSHPQAAELIRADRIDILVDLTMHMAGNRLLVFARKPAPVQVSWLAYPGTTGLSTIDYRLTDPHLDPPGLSDRAYSEASIRLPETFWCYDPLDDEPPVNELPAAKLKFVTFGCLNNFCKVNPGVLKRWASVLKAVERSRLMILAPEGLYRQQTLDLLQTEGVARHRVTVVDPQPRRQYLRHYHSIDIGLDTIPYNGHTTSLDSAWMGVPVVTLVGATVVGRAGLSQLTNLGLPELIASTSEQYRQIAVTLAHDLPRLRQLRATLRDRMQASPLMNAPRFARNVETAYRQMWRRWCAT